MSEISLHDSNNTPQRSALKGFGGAAYLTTTPGGTIRIREIDALSTSAETLDWSATPIKALVGLVLVPEAAEVIIPHTAVICIDPPNSVIRDTWLTAADSLTADSERIPVVTGLPFEQIMFTDSKGNPAPVSYVGIKMDIGASNCRVFAIGVEY